MESIAVALIGGDVVALAGAIASNQRSRAAIELRIDELTPRVEKHSCRIGYTHKLEQGMPVVRRDVDAIFAMSWHAGWRSRAASPCCWRRHSHAKRLHIRIATQRMKHIDVGRCSFRVRPLASSSRGSSKPTPP